MLLALVVIITVWVWVRTMRYILLTDRVCWRNLQVLFYLLTLPLYPSDLLTYAQIFPAYHISMSPSNWLSFIQNSKYRPLFISPTLLVYNLLEISFIICLKLLLIFITICLSFVFVFLPTYYFNIWYCLYMNSLLWVFAWIVISLFSWEDRIGCFDSLSLCNIFFIWIIETFNCF